MTIQELFELGMKRPLGEVRDIPGLGSAYVLNVGCGYHRIPGTVSVDRDPSVEPDILWDADEGIGFPWEGPVAGIHCYHMLEHVADPLWVLGEFARILAHGGLLNIVVPYGVSVLALSDLTHRSRFTEDTFPQLLANGRGYHGPVRELPLRQVFQMIAGIDERNLALMVQLVRLPDERRHG